ncbi:MAG: tRNA pseudouridine synthase A, partial [Chloroflexota bacterium]
AELERAMAPLAGEGTRIVGAGRTDAGVHAAGQAVHFDTDSRLAGDLPQLLRAWNARLPADVAVRAVRPVPPAFHARFSALSRTYCYRIVNDPVCSPLLRRYAHHVRAPLSTERMATAAQHLLGAHDFAVFAAQEGPGSTLREVVRVAVAERWADSPLIWHTLSRDVALASRVPHGPDAAHEAGALSGARRVIEVEVEANAFLRHMMRRIAGTLIAVGQGKLPPAAVASIIASGEKARAGQTAPARGLCLQHVRYDLDGDDMKPQMHTDAHS